MQPAFIGWYVLWTITTRPTCESTAAKTIANPRVARERHVSSAKSIEHQGSAHAR